MSAFVYPLDLPVLNLQPSTAGEKLVYVYSVDGGVYFWNGTTNSRIDQGQGLLGVRTPEALGLLAMSDSVDGLGGTNKPNSGQPTAIICRAQAGKTTGVNLQAHYNVSIAGATLTAGQNIIGVYTSPTANGTFSKVWQSADQSAVWNSVGAKITATAALSGPINPGDFVAIVFLCVGTTTPSFTAAPAFACLPNFPTKKCVWGITGQTTLPASFTIGGTATAAIYSQQSQSPFAALQ